MANPTSFPDDLLGETAQLRTLARSLLFDRHSADDVVQDAWLALLSAGQRPREAGAWLNGTVRRLVRHRARDEARRGRREEEAAHEERVPSAGEASGRIEILRNLLTAVEELEAPYREIIELRFFENLPPRGIARRTGLPVNTVRTRVRRGIEQLRARLDGEHEGRREELLAVLLPLAGPPPFALAGSVSLVSWTGTTLMMKKLLAVAALLLGLTYLGFRVSTSTPELAVVDPAVEVEEAVAEVVAQPSAAPTVPEPSVQPERVATESALDWVVTGRAIDATGAAVAGLRLALQRFDGYEAAGAPREDVRVSTAGDGTFTWALAAPPGAATVRVVGDDADYYVYANDAITLAGADPSTQHVTAHPRDVTAIGRTVDESGQPIAGALVEAMSFTTRTDDEGEFRLLVTSHRSSIRLFARAAGRAAVRVHLVPLGPGELTVDDLVLPSELRLHGLVRDDQGTPLENVIVRSGLGETVETRSDASGRFVVTNLDPKKDRYWLEFEKEGYARLNESLVNADLTAEREFTLVAGGVLTGRVVDAQGRPIEAARITVGNPPHVLPHRGGWSDPDGRFRITDIEPGERSVFGERDGLAAGRWSLEIPTPEYGPKEMELVLGAGSSISGLVLDPDGKPLAGVFVYGQDRSQEYSAASTRTDDEGRFELEGLPEYELTLGFLEEGFARHEVEDCSPGTHDLVVRLERSGRLAGLVVDDRTGAPVQRFRVRLVDPRLEEGEERLWGYSALWSSEGVSFADTNGVFEIFDEDLDSNRVIGVEITATGYAPAIADHVVTTPDPDPKELVIQLGAGAAISGRVAERDSGVPVANARVRCMRTGRSPFSEPDQFELSFEATTDSRGHFAFEGLPAVDVFLVVEHERFALAVDGPFAAGSSTERRIEVHSGASVAVSLLDGDGHALVGQSISLYRTEPRQPHLRVPSVETNDQGGARFDRLQPGTYQVSWMVRVPNGTTTLLSDSVVLAEQAHEEAILQPKGSATLSGTLALPDGVELPEQQVVQLIPREPELAPETRMRRLRGTLADHDYFEFRGVEPGSYLLQASFREQGSSTSIRGFVEVELSDAEELREVWLELEAYGR